MRDTETITEARRALGAQLAAFRCAAGYRQDELAPLTAYTRSTVANVETGRQNVPREFWVRCDEVLRTGGVLARRFDEIEGARRRHREEAARRVRTERQARGQQWLARHTEIPLTPAWAPTVDEARDHAVALWANDLELRTVDETSDANTGTVALRWLIAPSDDSAAHRGEPRRVREGDVTRLRRVRALLKGVDNAHGGGAAFPMAVIYLRREVTPLLIGRYDDTTGRRLLDAVAELMLDVGWMAYDAGDHELARHYSMKSLRLAHAAGNRLFGGRVLCAMSHQALHLRQVSLAVDLARTARHGTAGLAPPKAVTMFAAMEACAQAAAGQSDLCATALAAGEEALGRASDGDDAPEWLDFDEGGLWGHAARAYRDLGSGRDAERYAQRSIVLCLSGHSRTRAQRHALHAAAHAQLGNIDHAAAIGRQIVADAWNLHSSHVYGEVASLARSVAPTRSTTVKDFLAEARELFAVRQVEGSARMSDSPCSTN